jgi:hypothetical protein
VRRISRAGLAVVVALTTGGCAGAPPEQPRTPVPRLDASVTQFRPDEGTHTLRAGLTNVGTRTVTVSSAGIDWPGLPAAPVPVPDGTLEPGASAAFSLQYGAPDCGPDPGTRPRMVVVADGVTSRLPLTVEDPQLLERLRAHECAQQRLDATADISLTFADHLERLDGEEMLPGQVVVRRRPGASTPLRVVGLGDSVLLRLRARDGAALPVRLPGDRTLLRIPVAAGSAHRCDPHALSQSSQSFLLSVYVRLAGEPAQRVLTIPDERSKALLTGAIRRDCR